MNNISFFVRSNIIFNALEELFEKEGVNITFRVDPKYSKGMKLVPAKKGESLQMQYDNEKAIEILLTKTISYDGSIEVKEFYNKSVFEMSTLSGCREIQGAPVLSNMRIVHSKPNYRHAFDSLVKSIKEVSIKGALIKNPQIYVDESFEGSQLDEPYLW
ncbi:MAG: hypothetical protein V7765_19975 [Oleispira sp.]